MNIVYKFLGFNDTMEVKSKNLTNLGLNFTLP
jgi:hypothetical protein